MNLATVVQHHPARADLLPRLLPHLRDPLVVSDPDPDGKRDPWRCYQACLQAAPAAASHVLIVQDDALPCPDFYPRVEQALEERPDAIVCLFVSMAAPVKHQMLRAVKNGHQWAELNPQAFVPVVCTIYPQEIAAELSAWADALPEHKHRRSDDYMVSMFCRSKRIRAWAVVPSIVDHDHLTPSLIGARFAKHRAVAALADGPVPHLTAPDPA